MVFWICICMGLLVGVGVSAAAVYAIVPDPWFGLALWLTRQCWLSLCTMVTVTAPKKLNQKSPLSSTWTKKGKREYNSARSRFGLAHRAILAILLGPTTSSRHCTRELPWTKQHLSIWYQISYTKDGNPLCAKLETWRDLQVIEIGTQNIGTRSLYQTRCDPLLMM